MPKTSGGHCPFSNTLTPTHSGSREPFKSLCLPPLSIYFCVGVERGRAYCPLTAENFRAWKSKMNPHRSSKIQRSEFPRHIPFPWLFLDPLSLPHIIICAGLCCRLFCASKMFVTHGSLENFFKNPTHLFFQIITCSQKLSPSLPHVSFTQG